MLSTPFIAGSPIEVPPNALSDVINPANKKVVAQVYMGGEGDIRRAIHAADTAKEGWGSALAGEREGVLLKAAEVLEGRAKK